MRKDTRLWTVRELAAAPRPAARTHSGATSCRLSDTHRSSLRSSSLLNITPLEPPSTLSYPQPMKRWTGLLLPFLISACGTDPWVGRWVSSSCSDFGVANAASCDFLYILDSDSSHEVVASFTFDTPGLEGCITRTRVSGFTYTATTDEISIQPGPNPSNTNERLGCSNDMLNQGPNDQPGWNPEDYAQTFGYRVEGNQFVVIRESSEIVFNKE